jgi:hypothetical protein
MRNLQRSPALQILGAAGLTAASLLAYLAGGQPPDRVWALLWLVHFVHGTGGVLTVHARLEAMKRLPQSNHRLAAALWLVPQILAAGSLSTFGNWWLAGALLLPALIHSADLWGFRRANGLRAPLRRVGFRELGLSFVVSALTLAGLW